MEGSNWTESVEQQRRILLAANEWKGQRNASKASREQIFRILKDSRNPASQVAEYRTWPISDPYPPSTTPLLNLKPIGISELRLQTRHEGRALILRTFGDPSRRSSVQNGIEDKNGDVKLLLLHNSDPKADVSSILPNNTFFAIKEPLYKITASYIFAVRVDHPSDLVRLPSTHPLVPVQFGLKALEVGENASKYKDIGNAAFKAKQYPSALEAYTKGLHACSKDDDSLNRDLHRNRSIVNIYQGRYEAALDDACAALTPDAVDNEVDLKNNFKALYRAGRALYCLEQFSEAHVKFENLLQISPDDKDGQEQLTRTKARLEESATGKYDFTATSNSSKGGPTRVDCASFTANVENRPAGKKGRGLFATKDIKAGELVLVEKAFCVSSQPKIGDGTPVIMNLDSGVALLGPHAAIVQDLFQKMSRNAKQASRLLDLCEGGYLPKCEAKTVGGMTAIDMFQLTAISSLNCFGCGEPDAPKGTNPAGLWVVASYSNHACDANAISAFLGDCIILRATKDIEKGQEVSTRYRARDFDYIENQQALQNTWKFQCDCTIRPPRIAGRDRLIKEMTAFVEGHPLPFQYTSDKAAIATAEKLYAKLDATYDKKAFKDVPRPALAELSKWLGHAYTSHQNLHKMLPTAIRALQECGYGVKVIGQSLRIDRTRCYVRETAIDAAVCARHACTLAGKNALSKQFETFLRDMCLAKYGEMTKVEELMAVIAQSK